MTNVKGYAYNATAIKVIWNPVKEDRKSLKGKLRGYKVLLAFLCFWINYFTQINYCKTINWLVFYLLCYDIKMLRTNGYNVKK